jgi:hypothetical protein
MLTKSVKMRSHIRSYPSGAWLLTGYSRHGRFISDQRGNINTVTMPFIEKYSPLEVFQK